MTAFNVLASSHVVKNKHFMWRKLYQFKSPAFNGLECPESFNNIPPRVKLRIVACFENAFRLVDFYGGIFFYTPLELSFDKLLAEVRGFSFDEPHHESVDAP